jgi:WD40 repeat protein
VNALVGLRVGQCGKEPMNGTTTIDATLNPCSAEMDRHTYGWPWLNVSTHGKRLIRLHVGRLTLDVYRGRGGWFVSMGGGANGIARYWNLFTPLGSVTWITRKANERITG